MSKLEPQYALFDSVEQMLAPETLSDLISHSVIRVKCCPMENHSGLAGGRLEYVDTDNGRFVLKRMSIKSDWIMYSSNDHLCRSVTIWQYGLLDQLLPHLEHKIIACAHDGDGWAILMDDLTGNLFAWDRFPVEFVPIFLDTLARTHATFWNDSRLRDPRLGLSNTQRYFDFFHKAQSYTGQSLGVLPDWVKDGWEAMKELLDEAVYKQMLKFHENPQPILNALSHFPYTLLHGDYRAENLAYNGNPIAFDWQQATCSLMTIDLAWITKQGYVHAAMSQGEAISYYRNRLETYLNQPFENKVWQAMVDLGYTVDALSSTCLFANFYKMDEDPESQAFNQKLVKQQGQMVMDALCWL